MSAPTVIAVLGPTASGKTAWAIQLAQHFGAEIISCDSRQCYREMRIAVARPNPEELSAVPHHFIADRSIHQPLSAGQFEREGLDLLSELFQKNTIQVVVGGSGLFAKSLLEGFDEMPEVDSDLREQLNRRFEADGIQPLLAQLQALDPEHYEKVDRDNHQRVIRALEVCLQTGRPYSSYRLGQANTRPFNVVKVAPDWEREALYDRINRRVDLMVQQGLLEEAKALYPHRELTALQTVGYREFFSYFDGEYSLDEAIEKVKQNSRKYAKRQLTWNRKEEGLELFDPNKLQEVIEYVTSKIN